MPFIFRDNDSSKIYRHHLLDGDNAIIANQGKYFLKAGWRMDYYRP
jgi:hypothetical protein